MPSKITVDKKIRLSLCPTLSLEDVFGMSLRLTLSKRIIIINLCSILSELEDFYARLQLIKGTRKSLRLKFPKRASEINLRLISSELEDVYAQLQLENVSERVYV